MRPRNGRVGVVMPHGVLFRGGAEAKIRQCIIESDRLEAVIGLPANLSTRTRSRPVSSPSAGPSPRTGRARSSSSTGQPASRRRRTRTSCRRRTWTRSRMPTAPGRTQTETVARGPPPIPRPAPRRPIETSLRPLVIRAPRCPPVDSREPQRPLRGPLLADQVQNPLGGARTSPTPGFGRIVVIPLAADAGTRPSGAWSRGALHLAAELDRRAGSGAGVGGHPSSRGVALGVALHPSAQHLLGGPGSTCRLVPPSLTSPEQAAGVPVRCRHLPHRQPPAVVARWLEHRQGRAKKVAPGGPGERRRGPHGRLRLVG